MTGHAQKIILVTGASRGAGRGIALALARPGATIYLTGRTRCDGEAALPGSLAGTAAEVEARGARAIALHCDHRDDEQVAAVFRQIEADHGYLDMLVNNALSVPEGLTGAGPFWQKPLALQSLLDVGLRSSYVAAWYAAPLLIKSAGALLVNTSSPGGRCYMHGPAYGAGKAAIDKMAHDMAVDFRPHNVAVIALWMSLLKTERSLAVVNAAPDLYPHFDAMAVSPEFPGRVIAALAEDSRRLSRSGQVWIDAELALDYGVTDIDGRQPGSPRQMLGAPPQYSDAIIE